MVLYDRRSWFLLPSLVSLPLHDQISRRADHTRAACARNGADVVLHHLGAATRAEAEAVRHEIEGMGRRCVLVEGDISEVATSDAVSGVTVCPCQSRVLLVARTRPLPFPPRRGSVRLAAR